VSLGLQSGRCRLLLSVIVSQVFPFKLAHHALCHARTSVTFSLSTMSVLGYI